MPKQECFYFAKVLRKEASKMQKKKIAVIFGGNSTEYEVSLQSACSVFENINTDKFDIIPIGITVSVKSLALTKV